MDLLCVRVISPAVTKQRQEHYAAKWWRLRGNENPSYGDAHSEEPEWCEWRCENGPPSNCCNLETLHRAPDLQSFTGSHAAEITRLRLENRVRLPSESPEPYYYDVLQLCARVDPAMKEEDRVPVVSPAESIATATVTQPSLVSAPVREHQDAVPTCISVAQHHRRDAAGNMKLKATAESINSLADRLKAVEDEVCRLPAQWPPRTSRGGSEHPRCYYCHRLGHIAR
ncbi:hypothetical protein HPB52_002504 [Rhipicephalus sanguineus]|uniref:Uncharacterized protein n=1 Tax=Rhipicephalus sanguineus TaxID=34632 RepID=A0A9D4Q8C5_RHISA|nr:hypothetical protein HPB52_002504 [Rhipicephalus sanguineus]